MELLEHHFNNINDGNLYEFENTYEMFSGIGKRKHINYLTFKKLFENMLSVKDPIILESGIASFGIQSTYLFNEYIRKYGGKFWSVDINKSLIDNNQNKMCPATQLIHGDSVTFFKEWVSNNNQVDIIYLDSWDLDFYNPQPSGEHGLNEYKALLPVIKKNTLLLIDDTPINPYWTDTRGKLYSDMTEYYNKNNYLPGKGMYILNEPKDAELLLHNYQVLYRFN